ncbi:MAG: hypothetical protein RQ966_00060 [Acetobacteraceae bacterium]|nr:hypothetical protein [Acetobacteraceae bacterium]
MSGSIATKLNDNVAALLPRLGLPPAAAEQIAGIRSTQAALDHLAAAELLVEATRLVAHALPRREAVWWACMCARATAPAGLPAADRAALEAAETWVRVQSDEVRRAAFAHAGEAGFNSPEAWAAVGAFWSGDSLAPVGQAPVAPPDHVAANAVAGAVALASVRDFPERRADRLRRFLASARDIGMGGPGRMAPEAN